MNIFNILGLFGSILVGISFIPQTYKIIKTKNVNDISIIFISINLFAASCMIIYGINFLIIPVIIANISVLLNNIIIFIFICRNK